MGLVATGLAWVFCLKKPLAGLATGGEVVAISSFSALVVLEKGSEKPKTLGRGRLLGQQHEREETIGNVFNQLSAFLVGCCGSLLARRLERGKTNGSKVLEADQRSGKEGRGRDDGSFGVRLGRSGMRKGEG